MRITTLCVFLFVLWSTTANATLIDRGGGMIYDDVLDITWLSDANMGGSMNWDDSVAWADNLIFGGLDDWRLASMDVNGDQSDTFFGQGIVNCFSATEVECRDNELGYMFYYNLAGSLFDDLTGDQGLLTNVQSDHWSGTEFAPVPLNAWAFGFDNGAQGLAGKDDDRGAWAVRSGDVLAAPEPATLTLLGLGLVGIGMARRRS